MWGLQLCDSSHGDLLSCSSDGTLRGRVWGGEHFSPMEVGGGEGEEAESGESILVQLELPINALHYSQQLGYLACASDAEVLTFIDLG